jgi:hypothetical protein
MKIYRYDKTSISLNRSTADRLYNIKKRSETYDKLINELIDAYERNKNE